MRNTWWLSPNAIGLGWSGLLLLAYLVPEAAYSEFANAPKHLDAESVVTLLGFFVVFVLGASIGFRQTVLARVRREAIEARLGATLSHRYGQRVLFATGVLTCLAYLLWFAPMLNAGAMSTIVSGEEGGTAGRLLGNQISGVTTLTQFGIANAIIAAYALFVCRDYLTPRQRQWCVIWLTAMIGLAAFRSLAWAERLALIEVAVPVMLIWLLSNRRMAPRTLAVLPVVGLFAAMFVFGIFEYFRSWGFYQNIYSNYLYFSAVRFLSYYFTSFNNGALIIGGLEPSWLPLNTLAFVFKFPLLPTEFAETFFYGRTEPYYYALLYYGNPEFNTFSAPALIAQDFGRLFGALVFGGFGFVSGRLYRSFLSGSLAGLLLYPFWFVGFLDLGRILYWTGGRAFPALVCLAACIWFWQDRYEPRRRPARRKGRPMRDGRARDRLAARTVLSSARVPERMVSAPVATAIPMSTSRDDPASNRMPAEESRARALGRVIGSNDTPSLRILIVTHSHFSASMVVGSHHLARQFGRAGHQVLHLSYPVSVFHALRLRSAIIRERFCRALGGTRQLTPRLFEWLPLTLVPWPVTRYLWRTLRWNPAHPSAFRVRWQARRTLGGPPDLLFIEDPRMVGIERLFPQARLCYRVTDLHAAMRSDRSVRAAERVLLDKASTVVATSPALAETLGAASGRTDIVVVENGFDDVHFASGGRTRRRGEGWRPRAVYVGALDFRFDFDTLERLARACPDIDFVIHGALPGRGPSGRLSNLVFPGPAAYADLPAILGNADVALMPFRDLAANHTRSPMKLFEYLACGLPVVAFRADGLSRSVPPDSVYFYDLDDPGHAIAVLRQALADGVDRRAPATESTLEAHTWRRIAARVLDIVATADKPLTGSPGCSSLAS